MALILIPGVGYVDDAVDGDELLLPGGGYVLSGAGAVDTTAPTLSSPTFTATGSTTGTAECDTDETGGTMYCVVTSSATSPSVAQVQAGQDHTGSAAAWADDAAVSGTGTQTFSATGLAPSTTYYAHFQHQDAAANDSTVESSAGDATDAAAVPGFDFDTATGLELGSRSGSALSTFGVENTVGYAVEIYLASATNAAPVVTASLTTDSAGRFARYEHASISNATAYRIVFVRNSDGAAGVTVLTST